MLKQKGGKDIRTRSSFRIDSRDMSPDVLCQMNKYGLDLFDHEHLLITHSHEDHFDIAEIMTRFMAVPVSNKPLNIYLSKYAANWVNNILSSY